MRALGCNQRLIEFFPFTQRFRQHQTSGALFGEAFDRAARQRLGAFEIIAGK